MTRIEIERACPAEASRFILTSALVFLAAGGAWTAAAAQDRAVAPSPAQAASAPPKEKVSELESVTVTASRRRERAIDVPASLTVVEPGSLIEKGITDINGIADLVPNLKTTSGGSPSLGNVTIRGIFSGSAPTVGIYVDDVPYGPVVGGAGSSLALDATLFDIRRVEVVRGPQGTLFGAGSMGGVVRYITDDPSVSGVTGNAFADVSHTDKGGTNTLLRGKVSFPVVQDKIGLSVSAFDSRPDGYVDHPLRSATKVNGSTFSGGLVSALFDISNSSSIRVNAMHHEASYDSSGSEGFNPVTGQPVLGEYTDIAALPTPRKLSFDLYSMTFEHDFAAAKLTSVTSTQRLKFTNRTDLTASFGPTADALAPAGAPHDVGFYSAFDTKRFTQELRLTSAKGERVDWIVGAYYTDQDTADIQNIVVTPADIDLVTATSPTRYKELAAFGNLTYAFTPRWDVTGGIRIARNETTVSSNSSGLLVTPLAENTIADNVTTYLVNTRYRVSDALNLFARAASGYRPAGANLVTLDVAGNPVGQPGYQSDGLWSYEIGAKGELFDRRVHYDIGVYYFDWKRAQIGIVFPSGLGGLGNAQGGVEGSGVEMSLSGEVHKGLVVAGSLGVTNVSLKHDEPALGGLASERLPNTPRATASVLVDYRVPLTERMTASFGATWRYTGEFTTTFNGGTGADGSTIAPSQPNFTNPSYSQIDLRAGVRVGSVNANLYVTNLTNKHAYQTVFPIAATYAQGVVLRPRTVGVNVRYDF